MSALQIRPTVNWRDMPDGERRRLIAAMDADGMTADEIASALGLTRNALGGWCFRADVRLSNRVVARKPDHVREVPVTVWEPEWPVVGILELTEHSCRWPVGEPALREFCGCRITRGSYCATHAAIAYEPRRPMAAHTIVEHSRFAPFVSKEEARALAGIRVVEGVE
jgi:GcrA cell cycle regulator